MQDLVITDDQFWHGTGAEDHLFEIVDAGLEDLIDPGILQGPGQFLVADDLSHRGLGHFRRENRAGEELLMDLGPVLRGGPPRCQAQARQLTRVIVIGKVSWAVIPATLRKRILQHVARGCGLVYVTPHRLKEGYNNRTAVVGGRDEVFEQLFKTGDGGSLAGWIRHSTPLDSLPIHMLESEDQFTPLAGVAPMNGRRLLSA